MAARIAIVKASDKDPLNHVIAERRHMESRKRIADTVEISDGVDL